MVIECFVLLLLKKNMEYVIIIKNIEKSLHISIFFRTIIYEGEITTKEGEYGKEKGCFFDSA